MQAKTVRSRKSALKLTMPPIRLCAAASPPRPAPLQGRSHARSPWALSAALSDCRDHPTPRRHSSLCRCVQMSEQASELQMRLEAVIALFQISEFEPQRSALPKPQMSDRLVGDRAVAPVIETPYAAPFWMPYTLVRAQPPPQMSERSWT